MKFNKAKGDFDGPGRRFCRRFPGIFVCKGGDRVRSFEAGQKRSKAISEMGGVEIAFK